MKYEVTYTGSLTATPETQGEGFDPAEAIDRALDATLEELLALPDVGDPCMSGALATGEVEITVTVEAQTLPLAVTAADSSIRAAFHSAGVITAGWDGVPQPLRVSWHKVEADDLIQA